MKNSADLGGCYPPRPSASVDNALLDLQNSSYPTQPHSIIANYSVELQTVKQSLTTSTNFTKFTYGDFPCHLKLTRDKLAFIYFVWKCEKGERSTITANSFTRVDQIEKILPALGTSQIAGFIDFRPLTN